MSHADRPGVTLVLLVGVLASFGVTAAQPRANLYRLAEDWPQLPSIMNGGQFGETIGVDRDSEGHIWVLHRCFAILPAGAATCVGRDDVPPILKFDASGQLLDSWGAGTLAFPHGFHIDHDGKIWATDANFQAEVLGLSASGRGHQVFKFSASGELLLTLGTAGVAGDGPDTFDRPTDVAVAANGDIFVTDGHGRNNRVVKFSKEGRFIMAWGRTGAAPGEFNQPHTIALDSRGRVFIGDRSNSRIQIFDSDGNFIDQWTQFGRPSGMFIAEGDTLYVTDSTSNSRNNTRDGRGASTSGAPETEGSRRSFPTPTWTSRKRTVFRGRRASPPMPRERCTQPMSARTVCGNMSNCQDPDQNRCALLACPYGQSQPNVPAVRSA